MTAEATCQVYIVRGRGLGHTCRRPVAGTVREFGKDIPACSMHVKAAERRDAGRREADEIRRLDDEYVERIEAFAAEHGIDVSPDYQGFRRDRPNYSRTHVVVALADLCRLLGVERPA